MHLYDVIFEDEDNNVETVYEAGSFIAARCFMKSFRENFANTGVNYHLYIVPAGAHHKPNLKVVGKDVLDFPDFNFHMKAAKPPKNSKCWFESFEEDKLFRAKSIHTAQMYLDALCEVAKTKSDPYWEEYGPVAVPIEEDTLDI